jgi:hypothetical protein
LPLPPSKTNLLVAGFDVVLNQHSNVQVVPNVNAVPNDKYWLVEKNALPEEGGPG